MTEFTNLGYEDMATHRKEVTLEVAEIEQLKNGKVLTDGSLTSNIGIGPKMDIAMSLTLLVKLGLEREQWRASNLFL